MRRAEWLTLAVLLAIGFVLRAYRIADVGINHFDEGAYAVSALGRVVPGSWRDLYPGQHLLSPPLYFTLTGAAFRFTGGPSDLAPILVNLMIGTATIALVWAVARAWYGPAAGVAAAALLALNDLHIRLSRSGMTDALFTFLFSAALYLTWRAIDRDRVRAAVIAGIAVGLAWNTKYHGWLVVAVAVPAVVLDELLHGIAWRRLGRRAALLAVVAVVAAACYVPWVRWVMGQPGGYAALARWHTGYLSMDWLANLRELVIRQDLLEGPTTRASIAVAWLAALLVGDARGPATPRKYGALAVAAAGGAAGALAVGLVVALIAATGRLSRRASLADAFVAGWFASFFVLTPFYEPYARLILPLMIVAFLLAGDWLGRAATDERTHAPASRLPAALAAGVALALLVTAAPSPLGTIWKPAGGMQRAAIEVAAAIPRDARVLVVLEPSLTFYLRAAGIDATSISRPSHHVGTAEHSLYLVEGRHARKHPSVVADLSAFGDRLREIGSYDIDPVDLEVLDSLPARAVPAYRSKRDDRFDVTLYRVD